MQHSIITTLLSNWSYLVWFQDTWLIQHHTGNLLWFGHKPVFGPPSPHVRVCLERDVRHSTVRVGVGCVLRYLLRDKLSLLRLFRVQTNTCHKLLAAHTQRPVRHSFLTTNCSCNSYTHGLYSKTRTHSWSRIRPCLHWKLDSEVFCWMWTPTSPCSVISRDMRVDVETEHPRPHLKQPTADKGMWRLEIHCFLNVIIPQLYADY